MSIPPLLQFVRWFKYMQSRGRVSPKPAFFQTTGQYKRQCSRKHRCQSGKYDKHARVMPGQVERCALNIRRCRRPQCRCNGKMAGILHKLCRVKLFLNDAGSRNGRHRSASCRELLSAAMKTLIVEIAHSRKSAHEAHSVHKAVQEMEWYTQHHCREPIDNRTIADRMHFHPVYCNRIFKNGVGSSIRQFLLQYRLRVDSGRCRAGRFRGRGIFFAVLQKEGGADAVRTSKKTADPPGFAVFLI